MELQIDDLVEEITAHYKSYYGTAPDVWTIRGVVEYISDNIDRLLCDRCRIESNS